MEKIAPITTELLFKTKKLRAELSDLNEIIIDRINYIINFIYKTLGKNKNFTNKFSWWFDGADEGQVGDYWQHSFAGDITFCTDVECCGLEIIDKDGKIYSCEGSIRERWLFEDFENEVIVGRKLLEERDVNKKLEQVQLKEQNEKEKQKLIESAKKKLTVQELNALGLSKL